jgi:hypothetical protein
VTVPVVERDVELSRRFWSSDLIVIEDQGLVSLLRRDEASARATVPFTSTYYVTVHVVERGVDYFVESAVLVFESAVD